MVQVGGIDANQIVTDLMALERRPVDALEQRQATAERAAQALSGIRSDVDAFRFAALRLAERSTFGRFSTTSSSSAVVATAGESAVPSSLTFSVTQLASNHALRSVDTVASSDTVITAASTLSIAVGGAANGIGMVRSGAGLTAGDHDVAITQASAAATKRSDAALTTQTIGAGLFGNDPEFVDVEIDGVAASIEFTAGSYTAQELADRLQQGLADAGLDATAALDGDGRLVVTTGGEGSANTIRFTGGSALANLELTADTAAIAGVDAIVNVGGTVTTLNDVGAGTTVSVSTDSGLLELDLTGGLRVGTLDVTTYDLGSGTLADVAAGINAENAGVSASAIRVGEAAWRLQLTSRTGGASGELLLDDSQLTGLGGLVESAEARDAQLVVGEGVGAFTVDSSSNTFTDVLVGTTLTVSQVTTDPVTVGVTRNNDALASDVAALVSAANSVLADIKVQTRYGVDGAGNGALAGNSTVRRIADDLRNSLSRPVDGFGELIGADVGIQIDRDGGFTFDRATFVAAMEEDPAAVARFFGRSATAPAGVTFGSAAAETATGSYAVEVTTAATQATSARLFDGGVATSGRIGIRVGDLTATVDLTAGQTAAQAIEAINDALESTGLDITAVADAGGLVLRSDDWGTAGSFELNTDLAGAGTWDPVDGVNVAGTIDGVVATGTGRTLALNTLADSPAAGLSLTIDGGVSGLLGDVEYQPGIAARVAEVTTAMLGDDGTFDSAEDAAQRRITDLNDDIDRYEDRLFEREQTLRAQWSRLQTLLAGLQQQGDWLSSQLAGLPQIQN